MRRSAAVHLYGSRVGRLAQRFDGRWSVTLDDTYREIGERPVLGQWFERDIARQRVAKQPGRLPTFFANLLPEARALRSLQHRCFAIRDGDEPALLTALGADLPGAVTLRSGANAELEDPASMAAACDLAAPTSTGGLRFSLAGVQLKFSMIRDARGLTIPASGQHGKWIVKMGSESFAKLAENEFVVMSWAQAAGFQVPDIALVDVDEIHGVPDECRVAGGKAYAIRRYDRSDDGPIHQEDFAQVMNVRPGDAKYDSAFEKVGKLVRVICGEQGYDEYVRRLVLMLAAGNDDAHLKNWSLVYPDRIRAELAPLYDQVCIAYYRDTHPRLGREMALRFANLEHAAEVDTVAFQRFARRCGADPDRTVDLARSTARDLAATWPADSFLAPALREQWQRVHFLRESATLAP